MDDINYNFKIHTNSVEGLWKHLKDILRKFKGLRRKYYIDSVFYATFLLKHKIYDPLTVHVIYSFYLLKKNLLRII